MSSFQVPDGGPVIEYDDRELTIKNAKKNTGIFTTGWVVKYSKASSPNSTASFKIESKNTSGMSIGGMSLKFHW